MDQFFVNNPSLIWIICLPTSTKVIPHWHPSHSTKLFTKCPPHLLMNFVKGRKGQCFNMWAADPYISENGVNIKLQNISRDVYFGVPAVVQRKQIQLASLRMQIPSLASPSGWGIQCDLQCRSQTWLGSRIAMAVA